VARVRPTEEGGRTSRLDRKRVSDTLRIESWPLTHSTARDTATQQKADGKFGLAVLLWTILLTTALSFSGSRGSKLAAAPGDLLFDYLPFSTIAPQDITYDTRENCFWVTAFLDDKIYKYSADLDRELEQIPSPFATFEFQTGIAYNPADDTLFVTSAASGRVVEIEKDGTPTLREITIPLSPDSPSTQFTIRSLVFDALGDGGRGSLYAVESQGTAIYEFSLLGDFIKLFTHPEDPDGFPGEGRHAASAGLSIIRGDGEEIGDGRGELEGYYVTGIRGDENRVLRLDSGGDYTGVHLSLNAAGGTVSSILPHSFPKPAGGTREAWICVVESNARFAVIEAGDPPFREIFDLECNLDGRHVTLGWQSRQEYEVVEVVRDCEVVATLEGSATHFETDLDIDGTYSFGVRAETGDDVTELAPCTLVVGPGQILAARLVEGDFPADLTIDPDILAVVVDARERNLYFFDANQLDNPDVEPLDAVPLDEEFVPEDEFVTGISNAELPGDYFVYNTSRHLLARTNFAGEVGEIVEVALPNLNEDFDPEDPESEPDLGLVIGIEFDPDEDEGRGAFWVVELVEDTIYLVSRTGEVLRSIPSPFHEIEPAPFEDVFSVYTSGVALVASSSDQLWITGGAFRDGYQRWIGRIDKTTGELIEGSLIPTTALTIETGAGNFTLASLLDGDEERLFVLPLAGDDAIVAEIDLRLSPVPGITYLSCRQESHENNVELTFTNNGPYESIEVFRDCEFVATAPGDATKLVDVGAPAGIRDYAVRGVIGEDVGDFTRCQLRVGPGAVLQRTISYPARSPQQVTRDPVDGSFFAVVNWLGDERNVYHFDASFELLDERVSVVDPTRQIATLAVRATSTTRRLLYYIDWLQPVPLGQVDEQQFFLISETMDGELVDRIELDPPRPTNGFITFPTGLTWDPVSDTFFYLERNSKTFVRMRPDGTEIARFAHPDPPFQNFVFNLGLTVSETRRSLFFTTSDPEDHGITKIREMSFDGVMTDFELPVSGLRNSVRDIELVEHGSFGAAPGSAESAEFVVVGSGRFWELLRLKATFGVPRPFVRGDADLSGEVNVSDAVQILEHLFRGGARPACPDAADVDDSGKIAITDAVRLLGHLFRGEAPLPAPYPDPGQDTTPDGLSCR